MQKWIKKLKTDPTKPLIDSDNFAIKFFTKKDLLDENVERIEKIWNLEIPQKIIKKQRENGSWDYPGKKADIYPPHHYPLLETWKQLRILVERYEFNKININTKKAAEFLFSCQTKDGDFRGMIGNQYATYYTGATMAVLIKAGYEDDTRIEKGFKWLLSMRQNDNGWSIPLITHKFDKATIYKLTSENVEPIMPDRTKPFSHNWTDMVLRAFAVHPKYSKSEEASIAGNLLKSRFFKSDVYSSYKSPYYWVRFAFWWPNIYTSLDSLSKLGFSRADADIKLGLDWFVRHQKKDGLWAITYVPGKNIKPSSKNYEERLWLSLNICRMLKRFYDY